MPDTSSSSQASERKNNDFFHVTVFLSRILTISFEFDPEYRSHQRMSLLNVFESAGYPADDRNDSRLVSPWYDDA